MEEGVDVLLGQHEVLAVLVQVPQGLPLGALHGLARAVHADVELLVGAVEVAGVVLARVARCVLQLHVGSCALAPCRGHLVEVLDLALAKTLVHPAAHQGVVLRVVQPVGVDGGLRDAHLLQRSDVLELLLDLLVLVLLVAVTLPAPAQSRGGFMLFGGLSLPNGDFGKTDSFMA